MVNPMSREAFEAIVGKVMLETEFRYLLLANPDQALAGFTLTEEEEYIIKRIDGETLDLLSQTLEHRTRKIRTGKTGPLGGAKNGQE